MRNFPWLIILFFLGMSLFKIFAIFKHPHFNQHNDTLLFWTESALQYRNARTIANFGFLPAIDKKAQYPEGLEIKNRLTILMESTAGYFYRIFVPKSVPFHIFLVIFISLWSSLSIFPLYLLANLIFQKRKTALLSSIIYGLTPAGYSTVLGLGYELQDFALPLIFFHLYFFAKAMKGEIKYAFLSGSFLFAALGAWHLTQFYYILLVIFILLNFLFNKNSNLKPFFIITGINIFAGLTIPTLKSGSFLVSLPMLFSYALLVTSVIPQKFMEKRLLFGLIALLFIFGIRITTPHIEEYNHVFKLMMAKLVHLGKRPTNPQELSWETLCMWVSPFTNPTLKIIFRSFGSFLLFGPMAIFAGFVKLFRKKDNNTAQLILYFSSIFSLLYLFFIRMDVFLVWFLAIEACVLLEIKTKLRWVIMVLGLLINGYFLVNQEQRFAGPNENYLLEVIRYIRYNIAQDAPILTTFAYGPSILTDTERPILLHSKFEEKFIRKKISKFEHNLFKSEDEFWTFCEEYGAEYFIYQTDILLSRGPESIRYRTHNLTVSKNCAVFKFHFRPNELKHFELVYTNSQYRIFRVLNHTRRTFPSIYRTDYFRVYDERLFDFKKFDIFDMSRNEGIKK